MQTIYTEQDAGRSATQGTVALLGCGRERRAKARHLRHAESRAA